MSKINDSHIGWWCPDCGRELYVGADLRSFGCRTPCIPIFKPLDVPEECEPETFEIWTYDTDYGHGKYGGRFGEEYAFWIDEDKPHRAYDCLNRIVSGLEVW